MKTTILILILVLFSCSAEDDIQTIESCNCEIQYITATTEADCTPMPCRTIVKEVVTDVEKVDCQEESITLIRTEGNKSYYTKVVCE